MTRILSRNVFVGLLLVGFLLALVMAFAGCGGSASPGGPSPPPGSVSFTIEPASVSLTPGLQELYTARGEGINGRTLNWTLPSGGGLLEPLNNDLQGNPRARLIAGTEPGEYTIKAEFQGSSAEARFEVRVDDFIKVESLSPASPPGCSAGPPTPLNPLQKIKVWVTFQKQMTDRVIFRAFDDGQQILDGWDGLATGTSGRAQFLLEVKADATSMVRLLATLVDEQGQLRAIDEVLVCYKFQ